MSVSITSTFASFVITLKKTFVVYFLDLLLLLYFIFTPFYYFLLVFIAVFIAVLLTMQGEETS